MFINDERFFNKIIELAKPMASSTEGMDHCDIMEHLKVCRTNAIAIMSLCEVISHAGDVFTPSNIVEVPSFRSEANSINFDAAREEQGV